MAHNPGVVGSNPTGATSKHARRAVAQWQSTVKALIHHFVGTFDLIIADLTRSKITIARGTNLSRRSASLLFTGVYDLTAGAEYMARNRNRFCGFKSRSARSV